MSRTILIFQRLGVQVLLDLDWIRTDCKVKNIFTWLHAKVVLYLAPIANTRVSDKSVLGGNWNPIQQQGSYFIIPLNVIDRITKGNDGCQGIP
jgi:hypothetical protein